MRNFFLNMNTNAPVFKIFNILHIAALVFVFTLLITIIYNKKTLSNFNDKKKKRIRIIFGLLLIIFYILRRGSFIYYEVYDWKYHLSLGFCNMTNILFIIYCFTGNKKIYNICYYCAFCGPLLSILFPVINVSINNFSFINFIMIHHIVFLMNIVFAVFEEKKYSIKNMLMAYLYMIIYTLFCYLFNFLFETNYNVLENFISNDFEQFKLISFVVNNEIISSLILLMIGIVMNMFGLYILKLIRLGDLKNE